MCQCNRSRIIYAASFGKLRMRHQFLLHKKSGSRPETGCPRFPLLLTLCLFSQEVRVSMRAMLAVVKPFDFLFFCDPQTDRGLECLEENEGAAK